MAGPIQSHWYSPSKSHVGQRSGASLSGAICFSHGVRQRLVVLAQQSGRLDARGDSQLLEHPAKVRVDRMAGYEQLSSGFLVAQSSTNKSATVRSELVSSHHPVSRVGSTSDEIGDDSLLPGQVHSSPPLKAATRVIPSAPTEM